MSNNRSATLRMATRQALDICGVNVLDNPSRFASVLADLGDSTLPEVRVALWTVDDALCHHLAEAAQHPSVESLADAQKRVDAELRTIRFVEPVIASSVSSELMGGVGDWAGIAVPPSLSTTKASANPKSDLSRQTGEPHQQPATYSRSSDILTTSTTHPSAPHQYPRAKPQPNQKDTQQEKTKSRRSILPTVIIILFATIPITLYIVFGMNGFLNTYWTNTSTGEAYSFLSGRAIHTYRVNEDMTLSVPSAYTVHGKKVVVEPSPLETSTTTLIQTDGRLTAVQPAVTSSAFEKTNLSASVSPTRVLDYLNIYGHWGEKNEGTYQSFSNDGTYEDSYGTHHWLYCTGTFYGGYDCGEGAVVVYDLDEGGNPVCVLDQDGKPCIFNVYSSPHGDYIGLDLDQIQ